MAKKEKLAHNMNLPWSRIGSGQTSFGGNGSKRLLRVIGGVVVAGLLGVWAVVAPGPLVVFLFGSSALILLVRRARLPEQEGRLVMGIVMLAFLLRCGAGTAHYYYASSHGMGVDIFGDARAYSSTGHFVAENLWGLVLNKPIRWPNVDNNDPPWLEFLRNKYGEKLPAYNEYRVGLYGYFVGAVYALLGQSPVSLKWLHGFVGVLLAWLVYRILWLEGFRRSALVALVLVAFYPSLFLWSVSGLRELWVILLPWLILGFYSRSDSARRATLALAALSMVVLSDRGLLIVAALCASALAWRMVTKKRPKPVDTDGGVDVGVEDGFPHPGKQEIFSFLAIDPAVLLFGLISLSALRGFLRLSTFYLLTLLLLASYIAVVPLLARLVGYRLRSWSQALKRYSATAKVLLLVFLMIISSSTFWAFQSNFRDMYSALVSQQKRMVFFLVSSQRGRLVSAQVPMVHEGELTHYEVSLARTATKIFPERFYAMGPYGHQYIIWKGDVDLTFVEFGRAFLQGLVNNLFRPFPTNRGPFLHRLASYQMVGLYGLYLLAVLGGVHAFRRSWRRYWSALSFIAISIGVSALVQGNVGTMFRHRDTWVIMVLVLAAIGIVQCVDWARSRKLVPVMGISTDPAGASLDSLAREDMRSLAPSQISSQREVFNPCVLYVSYNSLFEPAFQSQALAYMRKLAQRGITFNLITFEKPDGPLSPDHMAQWAKELDANGISCFPRRYHKRPHLISTLYDQMVGAIACTWHLAAKPIDIVHARGVTPAAMVLLPSRLFRCPLIFDMRSSLAEAYADAGVWRTGGLWYRLVRRMETLAARKADRVVVETEAHRRILLESLDDPTMAEKVEVIPCCVDLERFAQVAGAREDEPWELVYLGSLSGWYRFKEMVAFYKVARESWSAGRMAFLTNGPAEEIRRWVAEEGIPEDEVVVESLPFADVPGRLARAQAGIVFTEPGRRLESLPVKVGEYLAAGLPLVVSSGMGDTEQLVRSQGVGVVVESFAEEGYRRAASELKALYGSDGSLAHRCREVARTGLSLEAGAEKYWAIYQSIGDGVEERQLFPATPGQA